MENHYHRNFEDISPFRDVAVVLNLSDIKGLGEAKEREEYCIFRYEVYCLHSKKNA